MTNDGLVAYRKVGGPDGVTIVPDLAAALPEISEDGLTYRFAIRDDVTYSNGDPVRPEDFRRALERSIALSADAASTLRRSSEPTRCRRAEACDLSKGIEVGEDSVTFHLAVPDGDLLFKLGLPFAFAVPADTPIEDVEARSGAGDGPVRDHGGDRGGASSSSAIRASGSGRRPRSRTGSRNDLDRLRRGGRRVRPLGDPATSM